MVVWVSMLYRGTSLIRKRLPLGPYIRPKKIATMEEFAADYA
jgi:hypothetical protein